MRKQINGVVEEMESVAGAPVELWRIMRNKTAPVNNLEKQRDVKVKEKEVLNEINSEVIEKSDKQEQFSEVVTAQTLDLF